ncbi:MULTISPECIES: hypothetical protein [Caldimonas]|uniref:hypothetical protein n=1 Tax=Caldimonas TaxID=196013 RepID=UPI0003A08BFD|nr:MULTISPECIES: hypothetical protein [Caldimonas]MCX7660935.1 hypothetical protein [Caldimonas manganoxidans]GIX24773.1 MAG: hypothetical protein KatS3mg122_2004 [Caldimonas sp.]
MARVILLQARAPSKPLPGQPCNGCGVCCAAEPCPLGQVLSRRRRGRCRALHWEPAEQRYRCGALTQPGRHLPRVAQPLWPWIAPWLKRWIAAGRGCDSSAIVLRP